jgi:hypothetical protein
VDTHPLQLCNRVFATQAFQNDTDLLFCTVAFALLPADLADMGFSRTLRPGF